MPPEGGRANDACAALLSDTFAATGAELVAGAKSREKRFKPTGVDLDDFPRQLERAVGDGAGESGPEKRPNNRR